jgi:hypothetical protein
MEDGNDGRFPRIMRKADDEDHHDHDDHENENECDITLNRYKPWAMLFRPLRAKKSTNNILAFV